MQVDTSRAIEVPPGLYINQGDTLYYSTSSGVSSGSNDGSVSGGGTVEFTAANFVISAGASEVEELPAPASPTVGFPYVTVTEAPPSGDLAAGQAFLWFDPTNAAGKLMVKAKTLNGTVVSGSVTLS